jgi:myo-inositol-1(or 4)-monophosphatase
MELQKILEKTIKITLEAAQFIKNEQNKIKTQDIEQKGLHNFVTYVDKNSEKILVEGLKKIIPQAGFITEEGTANLKSDKYNWIIDPLDGTTNYIHQIKPVAISIALQEYNETILGIVYEIGLDEMFYAIKGQNAYLNNKQIKVSNKSNFDDALIATGFPYYNFSKLKEFMQSLEFFMKNSHGIRRLGSAATDLAYVACGRFEAFYEYSLSPWDVAAGAFIVQQAGGKVSDFSGENNFIYGKEIIASNNLIFNTFLKTIKQIMNK